VGSEVVEAYVRDHGAGFDVDAVPADRLGVRESIIGRMRRHGGTARLRRLDDGTEVALTLPVTGPTGPTGPGPAPDTAEAANAVSVPEGPEAPELADVASSTGEAARSGAQHGVPASPAVGLPAGDVPVGGPPPNDPQGARP
jgi:hypothetical protein